MGSPSDEPSTLNVGPGLDTTNGTGTQKRIATIARRARRAVTSRQLMRGIRCFSLSAGDAKPSIVEVISVSLTVQLCLTWALDARMGTSVPYALSIFGGFCQPRRTRGR